VTYIAAYTPVRVHIVARASHTILETLRRCPSQGIPICRLSKPAHRRGVPEPDQPEIGQPRLILGINENVELCMTRCMSNRRWTTLKMITYVVDVPVRDGERVQIGDAFRDAGHLEMTPIIVSELRDV
jgi:hypothetical protein